MLVELFREKDDNKDENDIRIKTNMNLKFRIRRNSTNISCSQLTKCSLGQNFGRNDKF